jgi:small basic protein (TIGR04137 family)
MQNYWEDPFEKFEARLIVRASFHGSQFMSQHRSLKGSSTIAAKRNVLKRFERVELLKKRGQWREGSKVIGLPKTKPEA